MTGAGPGTRPMPNPAAVPLKIALWIPSDLEGGVEFP